MILPGKLSSEYNTVLVALAISACWILGIDVQPMVALLMGKEAADLMGTVSQAHPRGGWQAVAAMWGGVSLYVWVRGRLKAKLPTSKGDE